VRLVLIALYRGQLGLLDRLAQRVRPGLLVLIVQFRGRLARLVLPVLRGLRARLGRRGLIVPWSVLPDQQERPGQQVPLASRGRLGLLAHLGQRGLQGQQVRLVRIARFQVRLVLLVLLVLPVPRVQRGLLARRAQRVQRGRLEPPLRMPVRPSKASLSFPLLPSSAQAQTPPARWS